MHMRPIHPFPARMAPDAISYWLDDLSENSLVLDPMCGSGVVLRQSLVRNHRAIGFDIDPLAVLMSRIWTSTDDLSRLPDIARQIASEAKSTRNSYASLPSVKRCPETKQFVDYWFADPQKSALAKISHTLEKHRDGLSRPLLDGLLLAMSKTIVTKQAGASLAWDVSHSRPHKMREENDYDVHSGFIRSAERLASIMADAPLSKPAVVRQGDCRTMSAVPDASVDAVLTSPPYLNAIDYLRGHKLALVWMGYTIPSLRLLRSNAVGTEKTASSDGKMVPNIDSLERRLPDISRLPLRQRRIVHKYARDSSSLLKEIRRVIKPKGRLVLVLADSVVRGIDVKSSEIFGWMAESVGFKSEAIQTRDIPQNRRYLPINSNSEALANRMRSEIVQVFSAD